MIFSNIYIWKGATKSNWKRGHQSKVIAVSGLDMRHLYATGDINHVSDATDQIPDSATAMRGRRGLDRLVV